MNTNMFSEAFYRVLKIVHLRHQHNRRVDYLIYIVLKISRDKAFEQLVKMEKGKNTEYVTYTRGTKELCYMLCLLQ